LCVTNKLFFLDQKEKKKRERERERERESKRETESQRNKIRLSGSTRLKRVKGRNPHKSY